MQINNTHLQHSFSQYSIYQLPPVLGTVLSPGEAFEKDISGEVGGAS